MSKQHFYFWFSLFAFGTISFTLVQDTLRPNYRGQSEIIKYLLGVAPNYFAGLGLSSFFVVMLTHLNATSKKPATTVWLNNKAHISSIIISVSGLSMWEFIQILTSKAYFDWHDLLWTVLGSSTFYLIWITLNRKKNYSH